MYADDPVLASAVGDNQRLLTKQTTAAPTRLLGEAGVPVTANRRGASVECAIGRPAQEIAKAARKTGADLIVMGTRRCAG
jgi:nucleotide-binding universal stress UspA family protein